MTDRELMQQALEALENNTGEHRVEGAKNILRDRLAQPEQEPVFDCPRCGHCCPQRTRVGLTDDEIWKFWWSRQEVPEGEDDSMEAEFVAAVRRVLAAHGIGEKK